MRVLQINSVPYGSTCRVMLGIAQAAQKQGIRCDVATGYSTHPLQEMHDSGIRIGGFASKAFHMVMARLTGLNGFFSIGPTIRLIRRIRHEQYDLLHFHNLHGWYVNLPLLMCFVRKRKIPVLWTLHDCWAFTGQCAHYTAIGCERWKSECYACPQKHLYPQSVADQSRCLYRCKKRWFASLPNVELVTPSNWLAQQVSQSFLQHLPTRVIPNGVDLSVFQPTPGGLTIPGKSIVLGVANGWTERKGLNIMIKLADRLGQNYQIVLVGTDEQTDHLLPDQIISIHRTQNAAELAKLYTAADVFVNPTYEDTFPTVNLESLACGTPVITSDAGGSPECIDEYSGLSVPAGDVDALEKTIRKVCTQHPFDAGHCVNRARQFDLKTAYDPYLTLYRQKVGEPS